MSDKKRTGRQLGRKLSSKNNFETSFNPKAYLGLSVCNIDADTKAFRIGAEKLIVRDLRKEFIEELVRTHRSS